MTGELLGDLIELYSSVETLLALWSGTPVLNPINYGMLLVEKSILFTWLYLSSLLEAVSKELGVLEKVGVATL